MMKYLPLGVQLDSYSLKGSSKLPVQCFVSCLCKIFVLHCALTPECVCPFFFGYGDDGFPGMKCVQGGSYSILKNK